MAAITASMVGELRAKTDAPMMECKKALTEAEGNMEKAEELLRIKLGNKAGKASGRITAEGVVTAFVDGDAGGMIEINCETDFVTKTTAFWLLPMRLRCWWQSTTRPILPHWARSRTSKTVSARLSKTCAADLSEKSART